MGKHKHHIIPKHMGGTNDVSNLVELTVEEHAEAHRLLYEEPGHWQDLIAWKALSGQIDTDEIRRLKCKYLRTGVKMSENTKQKLREIRKLQKSSGWTWTDESRKKRSIAQTGVKHSEEHKQKISKTMSGISKPTLECPHCGKTGGAPQMKQWHFNNCKQRK